jgi:hypothetical protein
MKWITSIILIFGGITGMGVCFLSNITVTSSLSFIDGLNLSMAMGTFFVISFLSGLFFITSSS